MKGRANDKIRTKLRGGWPKLIGRAFSTIVDSLSFYSILILDSHCARHIWHESFVLAKYFKGNDQRLSIFSSLVERFHDEGEESLYFSIFFFFLQGETSLSFRGRDFSRSTVAQFSKIRRDSLSPGMRTILRYRVITQLEVRPLVRKRGVLFLSLVDFWWT